MKRRIPLNAFQKGVYVLLTAEQDISVYDDVQKDAPLPYISLGEFTAKPGGSKDVDWADVSLQVHIWSDTPGKKEVNTIMNDIVNIVTSNPIDLSEDGFKMRIADVDMCEAFPEETAGYHGVVTITAKIQNLGG